MAPDAVPPLVRRLLSPAAYPHPVRDLRLVETHISWVFLTGERVYKVKKPVDLGFLDFSTRERRKAFCEEEVRLNGRFAPWLYLGTVPIAGPAETAAVGGPGAPLEWAVCMAQFDERDRLDHVLDRGALSADDCLALAADIAAAQRGLAVAPPTAEWGSAPTFRAIVHLNLDQLVAHRPDLGGRAGALADWLDGRLALHADAFAARRRDGRVRECHGDLHLGNLVLHDGRVIPFDGIEFSEQLRWIDVANDVAFLAMDLHARGRADLAAAVISGWIEAADDHRALVVMPAYLVYRAIVRAAVAAIRAAQAEGDEAARAGAECEGYLVLAERLAAPVHPVLAATSGISGSGKSTVAAALAAALGAIRLRSDVERKRVAGLAPTQRPASAADTDRLYSAEMSARTYERLAGLAGGALAAGWSVVVDAACLRRRQRDALAAAATAAGVGIVWLELDVPADVAARRVRDRRVADADPSDATPEVVAAQLAGREPIDAAELAPARPGGAPARLVRIAGGAPPEPAALAALVRGGS